MTQKASLDHSPASVERRRAETDRRLAASPATGDTRAKQRRQIEAEIEKAELAEVQAAADRAAATAERTRIGSIVRLGRNMDRQRQALRAALLAPIGPEVAQGLLATMARDDDATPEALAVPSFISFGAAAAQMERRRIAGAFSHPEASARFGATVALILDSDQALTGEQVAPLLMALPVEADKPKRPSLAERAAGAAEFGCSYEPRQTKGEKIDAGWRKAVQEANASLGIATAPVSHLVGDHKP